MWSVNHSFHKKNENDFFTWVSLGLYLLWSVNHSFHKRNENDLSTWFSLGILLFCSVYHCLPHFSQDKPKLKEDYHHSTNMSSKYVLALFCLNVATFCAGCYVLIVEEIIDHVLKENIWNEKKSCWVVRLIFK